MSIGIVASLQPLMGSTSWPVLLRFTQSLENKMTFTKNALMLEKILISLIYRTEKKQWVVGLFCGCSTLYACRTVMPLSIVKISREMGWDKSESVS